MIELAVIQEEINKLNTDLIPLINRLLTKSSNMTLLEKVNSAYLTDSALDSVKMLRSVLEKTTEILQSMSAMEMLQQNTAIARTELCTASAKSKVWYKIPSTRRSDPIVFDTLMAGIGVGEAARTNELVRFHAPKLAEYMGTVEKIPDGFESREISSNQLRLSFRKR